MSGIELVAGVIVAFFAFGIGAGVLTVIALSALRGHRARERHRGFGEYDPSRTQPIDWMHPDDPDERDDLPPPWPGHRG